MRTLINILVSKPFEVPLELDFLERHALARHAFAPFHKEKLLVVVAPPGDLVNAAEVRVFFTDGAQGVN